MANNDINTGIKDAIVPEATPEEIAAFDIQDHLIRFLLDEPFYGRITRCLDKEATTSIATAGVTVVDGNLKLFYNPAFCAGLLKEGANKVKGLLKHEALHLVFEHCTTRRLSPHSVANIAADCAINSLIPENELPNCGIWPGKAELLTHADPIMRLIGGFPKGESQEWYFTKLMEDPNVQEALENASGQPGDGDGDGEGPSMPGSLDDHDGWDEMSEEEREVAKGKVKAALSKAVDECDKTGQ